MGVSENSGTPKSSILIGFSIINHPFWGTPIFRNTHIDMKQNSRQDTAIVAGWNLGAIQKDSTTSVGVQFKLVPGKSCCKHEWNKDEENEEAKLD